MPADTRAWAKGWRILELDILELDILELSIAKTVATSQKELQIATKI